MWIFAVLFSLLFGQGYGSFYCFFQNDVEEKCSDILKLGLLQGDMSPKKAHTGIREQIEWLEFPHKIFFDYVMAFYIEKQGEVSIENYFIEFL